MSARRQAGREAARPANAPAGDASWVRATYRLQFHKGFGFRDAARRVSYLADLGISHCYASPYLKAHAGSAHGYDIVDHTRVNPEVGSESARRTFVKALAAHGLGQILDVVPNHMRVDDPENRLWWDVLAFGRRSRFAHYFDIDWETPERPYEDKLVIPILGGPYGEILESGDIALDCDPEGGGFIVRYFDHRLPIAPGSYPKLLAEVAQSLERMGPRDEPIAREISDLIALFEQSSVYAALGATASQGAALMAEGGRRLAQWVASGARCAQALAAVLARYNGGEGEGARRYDALHGLLEQQAYRLAFWRVAGYEINYRRFFDINELAALRMEDPDVFAAAHEQIGRWIAAGDVTGLRIDHPDGLRDPRGYCARIQEWARGLLSGAGETARVSGQNPLYVVVEKILGAEERLPEDWPVHGTTGYDFARLVSGVLVDGAGEEGINAAYEAFVGSRDHYEDLLYECKALIMHTILGSEIHVLGRALERIAERDRRTRDLTLSAQATALFEIVACFPVYRTYVTAEGVSAADRAAIDAACAEAKRRNPLVEPSAVDFIGGLLRGEGLEGRTAAERGEILEFVAAFQQYTGPVMAKGLEDTLFYRYNRMVSLNEVGGDPSQFAVSRRAFHAANEERLRRYPYALLATSTHDSKRSEDLRARLSVLSEIPAAWRERGQWLKARHAAFKGGAKGVPSARDEYLFYQTLIGLWPLVRTPRAWADVRERLKDYMRKAAREAKGETSWVKPVPAYEEALAAFVDAVTDLKKNGETLALLAAFIAPIARVGLWTALSQAALKLTVPGVPDLYQGTELWDFHLVDPDNRQAVDYAKSARILSEVAQFDAQDTAGCTALLDAWLSHPEDGRVKMHLTRRLLHLRRAHPGLFAKGRYVPVHAEGPKARHVLAFARSDGDTTALVIVPRHYWALTQGGERLPLGPAVWGETRLVLPAGLAAPSWRDALTQGVVAARPAGSVAVAAALAQFPVAVLIAGADARSPHAGRQPA